MNVPKPIKQFFQYAKHQMKEESGKFPFLTQMVTRHLMNKQLIFFLTFIQPFIIRLWKGVLTKLT